MNPHLVATPAAWVALVPLLPLSGAIVLGLGGAWLQHRVGPRAVSAIACGTVAAAFLLALRALATLIGLPPDDRLLVATLWPWLEVGGLAVDVALGVDPLSAVMILVVTGVGGLIHGYAIGYMHGERGLWRFFAFLNLFTFAMLILVMAENLLLLFLGWEGVGFCSWALIGFWYREPANAVAGNKAFIVNRIGDLGFVLGLVLLFWTFADAGVPTLAFRLMEPRADVLQGAQLWGMPVATLATVLLFLGATGKSAQIPLYVWLPDAMAGPTPVSALIHAATMVTAGVYMIARLHWLFALAPFTLHLIAAVGLATAFLAATLALVETDIKKVLAYSTVSQLGYMMLAMGVGAWGAGIFHLVTHAFFKAGLFLAAGSVMHALGGEQDMRRMGGLWAALPHTAVTCLVATLAIVGTPCFAGFFSKDAILWAAFSSRYGHPLLWAGGTVVAGLTAFYMVRQFVLVFLGTSRSDADARQHLHESPAVMTVPLWILAVGAVVAGYLGVPPVLGESLGVPHVLEGWFAPLFGGHAAPAGAGESHGAHAELELGLMIASVTVAAGGALLAWLMYGARRIAPERVSDALAGLPYRVLRHRYWVDEVYAAVFVRGTVSLARVLTWVDTQVIDRLVDGAATVVRGAAVLGRSIDDWLVDPAVNAVADATWAVGRAARHVQTGAVTSYLYGVLLGMLGGVLLWWSWAAAR